ncbi:hypothetical protein MBM_01659 [Drepanopeziza brunnea f. sp. 'multigermtubi' MB_m1]|uniref:Uncharacterized protein n=1 Tax=Marssonina brunnea f. sp. multigermtubi (strain MB_m1) TaxID=1072389 RepID=K1X3Y0_MARBU|nr:uncharacterized protein MBM_01659 [Drepanopeziza brunnea f. sp. 'multigermtubi' MB_m1]EKD19707.1 hypothetical protein MBM_01659 [Drepanopeziza brunnea f. sp. 'multigermtubi' MB_m1]
MIYSMLPSVVQSRLPRLPSIRRSVSTHGFRQVRQWIESLPSSKSSTLSPSSGIRTPDAGYTSALVLNEGRETGVEEQLIGYFEQASSDEEAAPKTRMTLEMTEGNDGIVWKFANQGLSLLSLAVNESSTISQGPSLGNASFARQLYLHGLTYLIRGLPSDLTTEEQLSIRSSLPQGIVEPLHVEINGHSYTAGPAPDAQPSVLHRTLASSIVQLFIFLQFILPHLKYLLRAAYQYDREHKISEKVLRQGIDTVDGLGKTGLSLVEAIYGMGDGRFGQIITETIAWIVEGITGGIHEGLGEGMAIMGAPRKTSGQETR